MSLMSEKDATFCSLYSFSLNENTFMETSSRAGVGEISEPGGEPQVLWTTSEQV